MSAAPAQGTNAPHNSDALLFRRYSSAGLAHGAVEQLAGRGRMVFRPDEDRRQPFVVEPVRDQVRAAAGLLMLMVLVFPPIFCAADWLRYGVA